MKKWMPILVIGSILVFTAGVIYFYAHSSSEEDVTNEDGSQTPSFESIGKTTPANQSELPVLLAYYTGDEGSFKALQMAAPYLTAVSADVYLVQADGSINGSDEMSAMTWNDARNIETYACISNYNDDPEVNDFDAELAHAAIVTYREQLIESLVSVARDGGYAGINIDFENLAYSADIEEDRSAFTSFIQGLAERLHAESLKLIISVPGKSEESIDNTWAYPFDLAALGETADYLQLMTYDQHGPWGEPGAVAGADWVEGCLQYATSLVNPAKLLIGLPAYGYDWDLTASDFENGSIVAGDISWKDFAALVSKPDVETGWDIASQSPYCRYSEEGHAHIVWFENRESIQTKVKLVREYALAGVSVWALGKENENFWQAVEEGLK